MKLFVLFFLPMVLATPTLAPDDEFFDVLGTGLKEWRLVFRGQAYINKSVFTAYKDGSNVPAIVHPACKGIDWSERCDTHFRNYDALNHWHSVLEVMVGVVDGGDLVKTLTFTGSNTDYMNWFSPQHYINSSWPDLKTGAHNYYSIEGHADVSRRFFINNKYEGCPADVGWLVAVDQPTEAAPCAWEKDEAYPVFMYAAGDHMENWTTGNFRKADALVIFVRYSSGGGIVG